jgi:hypothetical protein
MMEKLYRYQIFVYLILIILILTVVKIKYGNRSQISDIRPQVLPTAAPTQIPTPEATPTINPNDEYPLWRELPYSGKGFRVDKYTAPMTLQVTIGTTPQPVAVKELTTWLNSFKEITKQHKIIIINSKIKTQN